MADLTYRQFRERAMELYEDKEYRQAYEYIRQHADRFPEHGNTIYNWLMCMAAQMGEVETSLRIFAQSLEAGYFWSEQMLRSDPDLESLLGLPEFEQLVTESERRYRQKVAETRPELLTLLPPGPKAELMPLLIVLHGRNSNAQETAKYWRALTERGWLVAVAQSSQPLGPLTYSWDEEAEAEDEIRAHYSELQEAYSIDPQRVLLSGFSQGAGLAIRLSLTGVIPAAGFIAVVPYLSSLDTLADQAQKTSAGELRGYLITGEKDPHQDHIGQIEDLLHAWNVSYQREEHAGLGHDYPTEWEDSLYRALDFILTGQEPQN